MTKKRPAKKRKKADKWLKVLIGSLAAVCLLAGGVYLDTFHGGVLRSFVTKLSRTEGTDGADSRILGRIELDNSSKAAIAVFEKEFLLCTKDGVKYYTAIGAQKWNDTFNMSAPTMVREGDYIAVGDMGGKTIRVYDREGLCYDLQTEGSPVQFALNESGYLSLITRSEDTYRIRIYNESGALLKERVEESSGIYPLSSDVSDDSRSFAVSYVDTTDIVPIGRVLLFYIGAEDSENYTDSIFAAAVERSNELIPIVSYRENGVLAVISDQAVYGIGSDGGELWSYPLENTIDQVALGDKAYIVLALGDSVGDRDGREKGTVCWLNDSGVERASFETGDSVTYLIATEKGVVIGNDRSYTGVTHGGNENWSSVMTGEMSDMIPMERLNRVMAVGQDAATVMDLSKAQESNTTQTPATDDTNGEAPVTDETNGEAPVTDETNGEAPVTDGTNGEVPVTDDTSGETPAADDVGTTAENEATQ